MSGNTVEMGIWVKWVKANLMADKKKAVVLAVLLVVAVVMSVKTLMPAPQTAAAQPTPAAETPAEPVAWAPTVDPQQEQRRSDYLAKMDRHVTRDLFAPDYNSFPFIGPQQAKVTAAAPNWLDKMRNRINAADSEAIARQKQLAAQIRSEATSLSLQSTVPGKRPTAIINGNMVTLGEKINGFVIREIGPAQCVLVKDGVAVNLRME